MIFDNLQHDNRPINLDALLGHIDPQTQLIIPYSCAELRLIIKDPILSTHPTYPRVVSRYR